MLSPCDLDLGPTWTEVSNGISTHDGELYKFILKFIQNSRSYGSDKNLTSSVTLGLAEQMFQMAHLHMMENNCVKLFEIHP